MIGRASPRPPREPDAFSRLARLTAAVDQAIALCDDAIRIHPKDGPIVDLALDIRAALQGARK